MEVKKLYECGCQGCEMIIIERGYQMGDEKMAEYQCEHVNWPCTCQMCKEEEHNTFMKGFWNAVGIAIVFWAIVIGALIIGQASHASEPVDMVIIATIESSNNPDAFNKNSGAIGLCQVRSTVLKDFDQAFHTKHKSEELYLEEFNLMVADWYMNTKIPSYLRHYHITDTLEHRLIAYNAGIGMLRKGRLPQETRNYIIKYHKLSKKALSTGSDVKLERGLDA